MYTPLRLALGLMCLFSMAACGGSEEEPAPAEVKVLTIHYWQAPSVPNPYLSGGNKDTDAGAVTLEPLAKYDPDGNIVPALASEVPTIENGGVSSDLMSITWKLKEGLKWSDETDVTVEDVVFTWRYCVDEATGCTNESSFDGIISVEALDDLTVKITFEAPTPYPYSAFVGSATPIISSVQFAECTGAAASTCFEQNYAPLGTGPYRITNFQPNDRIAYERNPHYHGAPPYFDRVILKGGGDATARRRARSWKRATWTTPGTYRPIRRPLPGCKRPVWARWLSHTRASWNESSSIRRTPIPIWATTAPSISKGRILTSS